MAKESKMLVTLKSGAQKWMTKHELKQHNKRLDSLKELYIKYIIITILVAIFSAVISDVTLMLSI